jgi:phospholipid/cholesterol/gamma-HCH transport system substrate-binding protein
MTRAAPRAHRGPGRWADLRRRPRLRRGPGRKASLRFLAFAIVTVSLTVYMGFKIIGSGYGSSYSLVASFDNVAGLKEGDLVKVAGAPVGRVEQVKVVLGKAQVKLSVSKSIEMPADSEAVIRWRNLIGQREVYLQPGQSGDILGPGGRITRTQSTVDLGAVINSLGPLTGSLDPDQINQILDTFSVALTGNQGNINQIISNLSLLLTTFGDRTATIDQMIKDYKTVTDTVAQRDLEIAQTVQNLQTLTQAFAASNGTLSNALVQLGRFSGNLGTVTRGNAEQIGAIVTSTRDLAEIAHSRVTVLSGVFAGLPTALQALLTTQSGGHFTRTALVCLNVKLTQKCPFTEVLPPPPTPGSTSARPQVSAADQATFGRLASLLLMSSVTSGGR